MNFLRAYSGDMSEHSGTNQSLKLNLSAHGVEVPPDLREFVHRRAHFGLGRFAGRIRAITVRLADVNGPRGGLDKCCDVRVDAGLPSEIFVREQQDSLYSAVSHAMERAERALRRRISLAKPGGKRPYRTGYSLS